jgi:uncharacterized protein with ParB-like and HNH nuclease domain
MQPQKVSITQLMADGIAYYVPFYQRAYVWKRELWDRFIKDMEYISSTEEEYFIGSAILKKREAKGIETQSWTIVDGQQRMTTLAIFYKVISLKDENAHNPFDKTFRLDDGTLNIKHSMIDSAAFEKIANNTKDEQLEGEETSNLIRAYNYFQQNLDVSKVNILNIKRRLWFIAIYLEEKENEHKIFDTINSIGMRLNTEQLLKNHLFSETTVDEYKKIWKPVFEADEKTINYWSSELSVSRSVRTSLSERFFDILLQIIMYDPRNKLSSEEKKVLKIKNEEKQFGNYQRIMEAGQWDKITFAKEITTYARIFKELFVQNVIQKDSDSFKTPLKRILLVVFNLEVTAALPYIIFVVKNCPDKEEKNRIFTLLESYIVRRIICNKPTGNYSDLFSETLIGKRILTYDDLCAYLKTKKPKESLHMPYDIEIEKAFAGNTKIVVPKAKVILYLLESSLRKDEQTQLRPLTEYTLEHLMPQAWEANWPIPEGLSELQRIKFKDERTNAIKVLGNMGIITNSLNAQVKNYAWQQKLDKGLRKKADGILTLKSAISRETWDEESILDRAEWLAGQANEVWKNVISSDEEEEAQMIKQRMDEGSFFSMYEEEILNFKEKRRPPFKFSMVDLKPGDRVQFTLADIEVVVADEDRIEYEGAKYSLSDFCKKFDPFNNWKSYQGPKYFTYGGKTLAEIRKEKDSTQ